MSNTKSNNIPEHFDDSRIVLGIKHKAVLSSLISLRYIVEKNGPYSILLNTQLSEQD